MTLEEQVRAVFVGREVADCGYASPTFVIKYEYPGEVDDYDESSIVVRHVAGDRWGSGFVLHTETHGTLEEIRDKWYAEIVAAMRDHLTLFQTLLHNTVQELSSTVAPKKGTLVFVRNNEGWVVGANEVYAYPVSTNRWRAGARGTPMYVGNTAQDAVDRLFEAMPAHVGKLTRGADDSAQAATNLTELLSRVGIEYVPDSDNITK